MPPSVKKQKLHHASDISRPGTQRGIRAFGTISKPLAGRHEPGKSKFNGEKSVDKASENVSSVGINRLKRKREVLPEHSSIEEDLERDCCPSSQAEPQDGQQGITAEERELFTPLQQLAPKQPSKTGEKARTPSQINHDCTTSGRACFESLPLEPSSPSDLNVIALSAPLEASETPVPSLLPTESLSQKPRNDTLDDSLRVLDEVQDLIDLYSSFLTALSLHYAHNGWPTPADLRVLRPSIERSWRRKRVTNDDVRRILRISQDISAGSDPDKGEWPAGPNDLSLIDYGNGKICIDMNADPQSQGFQKRPLDEEALNRRFVKNLMRQWDTYRANCKASTTTTTPTAGAFTSQLPLASITLCASVSKISPLLAKGQQRLEDLKAGAIRAQQNSSKSTKPRPDGSLTPPSKGAAAAATTSRNDSLLSRIRTKQLLHQQQQSTLTPLPLPTQASILRKSALQRLHEIIPVLEILTTTTTTTTITTTSASSRSDSNSNLNPNPNSPSTPLCTGTYSYTMPTLVQHLQMSLRNPIAKVDAVRCLQLLAGEVAPEWIAVREVGKVVGVTIWMGAGRWGVGGRGVGEGGGFSRAEVERRIEGLLVAC